MSHCIRCRISGQVQGVWFRASTQQQAVRLGISGSARNLPDGDVEVVACGEPPALKLLQQWLWEGPAQAQVKDVQCEAIIQQAARGFTTG